MWTFLYSSINIWIAYIIMLIEREIWHCNMLWTFSNGCCIVCLLVLKFYWVMFSLSSEMCVCVWKSFWSKIFYVLFNLRGLFPALFPAFSVSVFTNTIVCVLISNIVIFDINNRWFLLHFPLFLIWTSRRLLPLMRMHKLSCETFMLSFLLERPNRYVFHNMSPSIGTLQASSIYPFPCNAF